MIMYKWLLWTTIQWAAVLVALSYLSLMLWLAATAMAIHPHTIEMRPATPSEVQQWERDQLSDLMDANREYEEARR